MDLFRFPFGMHAGFDIGSAKASTLHWLRIRFREETAAAAAEGHARPSAPAVAVAKIEKNFLENCWRKVRNKKVRKV